MSGWNVVAGSAVGIAFGSVPVFASGFAILAASMAREFGWGQAQVGWGATSFLLVQTFAYPFCGWPLERFGSRKFAVASIVALAIALFAFSQVGNSLTQFYICCGLVGLLGVGTNVVSYARAIALWFSRRRGIALGIAASAQALGSFLIPFAEKRGIAAFGWSGALMALAAFEIAVCAPLVALLVRDRPASVERPADASVKKAGTRAQFVPVTDMHAIARTATFWKLAVCFAVMGLSFYAIAPNIVYILVKSAKMSIDQVVLVAGVSGIAALFGRIIFGFLLDHLHAPLVGFLAILCSATSAALYAFCANPTFILLAAVAGGFGIGGETDLMPYLASRYFGRHAVAKVFPWFLFAFFSGSAGAPIVFAKLSESFGGSFEPLIMLVVLQILPAGLFLSLGPYPEAIPACGIVPVARPLSRGYKTT